MFLCGYKNKKSLIFIRGFLVAAYEQLDSFAEFDLEPFSLDFFGPQFFSEHFCLFSDFIFSSPL